MQSETPDPMELRNAFYDLGTADRLWMEGDFEAALVACDRALPVFRHNCLQDPLTIAHCLHVRGNCLTSAGRFEDALIEYESSLPFIRQYGSHALAQSLENRAFSLDALGRSSEALTGYDEALALPDSPGQLASRLSNRATCLQRLGRFADALIDFDKSFTMEDRNVVKELDFLSRISLRERTIGRYRTAITLAHIHSTPERAWSYVQRAKGRTLTDLLSDRAEFSAIDRQELLLVQQYESGQIDASHFTEGTSHFREMRTAWHVAHTDIELLFLRMQQISGEIDDDSVAAAIKVISDRRDAQKAAFHEEFPHYSEKFPGYSGDTFGLHDLRYAQKAARREKDIHIPLSLQAVTSALEPEEVLLDCFTCDDAGALRLYLLRPGQPKVAWDGSVDGAALTPLVQRWGNAHASWREAAVSADPVIIARRDAIMATAATIEQALLNELGQLIFAPVLEQLDESVTTLIVSPDGLLHRLPLAAVTVMDREGHPGPLIDRLDVQLVPTASSLVMLRGPHGPRLTWPAALLAAAPFALDEEDEPTEGLAPSPDRDRFRIPAFAPRNLLRERTTHNSLAYSGSEVCAVADCLRATGCPASVVLNVDATRARLETDLPTCHVLHLATHGGALKANETVMDYRIFLADGSEIRVRELYEGSVTIKNVVLVNLSACSLGEVVLQGAEASGFVQAFLQAGAGVVLAPLWSVDDHATKELMVRFYEELTSEERPTMAHAWRRATQRLRTETRYTHPVYWAGFLPSGDASLRLMPAA